MHGCIVAQIILTWNLDNHSIEVIPFHEAKPNEIERLDFTKWLYSATEHQRNPFNISNRNNPT